MSRSTEGMAWEVFQKGLSLGEVYYILAWFCSARTQSLCFLPWRSTRLSVIKNFILPILREGNRLCVVSLPFSHPLPFAGTSPKLGSWSTTNSSPCYFKSWSADLQITQRDRRQQASHSVEEGKRGTGEIMTVPQNNANCSRTMCPSWFFIWCLTFVKQL